MHFTVDWLNEKMSLVQSLMMMSVSAIATIFLLMMFDRVITQYIPLIQLRNPNRSVRKRLFWGNLHARDLKLSSVGFLGSEASWPVA